MLQEWRTAFLIRVVAVTPLMAAAVAGLDFHDATDKLVVFAQGEA